MDTKSERFLSYVEKACSHIRPIQLLKREIDDFWIAGGFLRALYKNLTSEWAESLDSKIINKLNCNDLDIYFSSAEDTTKAKKVLDEDGYFLENEMDHVASFLGPDGKFDIVKIKYDDPEDCLSTFDMNIVACAYHINNDKLFHHRRFFQSNDDMEIKFLSSRDPVSLFMRIRKYQSTRGYDIPYSEMIRAFAQVVCKIPEIDSFETFKKIASRYRKPFRMKRSKYEKIKKQIDQKYKEEVTTY